jgi:hypothetical protein
MRASASGCWLNKGSRFGAFVMTDPNDPNDPIDQLNAWAKKHWVLLTAAATIVLAFAVSPFLLTLLVAIVVAWAVVKYVKKSGGPEAVASKIRSQVEKHL